VHGDGSRRVRQEKQADDADPEDPPGGSVAAPFIGDPAAQGANDAGRQDKYQGNERGLFKVEPVLRHVVLGQPEGKRHEAAKHEVIGKPVPPDPRFGQRLELLPDRGKAGILPTVLELGVVVGEKQENERHHQHRDGIDDRYRPPAQRHDDQWCDEDVQCCARVAGAEYTHRDALLFLAEPGGGVGDADGE
jgi:hypothetical protein